MNGRSWRAENADVTHAVPLGAGTAEDATAELPLILPCFDCDLRAGVVSLFTLGFRNVPPDAFDCPTCAIRRCLDEALRQLIRAHAAATAGDQAKALLEVAKMKDELEYILENFGTET